MCELFEGSLEDASLDALADNADHGLRRSNEDKRNAVERCLALRPEWTQEKVAEWCAVTQMMVSHIIAERAAINAQADDSQTSEYKTVPNSGARTSKRGRKGEGKKPKKEKDAERIGAALKKDAERDDTEIATVAHVNKICNYLETEGDRVQILLSELDQAERKHEGGRL